MDKEMEAIKKAIIRADFELLDKLLTNQTPEFCSSTLHHLLSFRDARYNFSEIKTPELIPVDVKEAFKKKEREFVQIFLNHGADVNCIHENWSIFSHACLGSSASVVKMMIDHGADVEIKNSHYLCPIEFAFKSGDTDKMNLFLDLGIDSMQINRSCLLRFAAATSLEIVMRLVKLGADVNFIDADKIPVIVHAVRSRKFEIVKYLIECGADLNKTGEYKRSALEEAVSTGNIKLVKLLLENGANVNWGLDCPLIKAIKCGNMDIAKLLLENGANIDGCGEDDEYEESPMCIAVSYGHVEILESLLNRGAKHHKRALIWAITDIDSGCAEGSLEKIVKILLERGYDPNCKGTEGDSDYGAKTALSWAVSRTKREVAKLLLDYGAQVDGVSEEGGKTALHVIADDRFHCPVVVQILLDYGADINKEYQGRTALTMAVHNRYIRVCKLLVSHMLLIKAQDVFVSEENMNASKGFKRLERYQKTCEEEINALKSSKFHDSNLSYFDIFTIKDVQKLASLANNQNIFKVLKSNDFRNEFPIYSGMIGDHFYKGILRKQDFELLKRFINYLSTRNHDKLPKLPSTFVYELFTYLTAEDVAAIKKLQILVVTL